MRSGQTLSRPTQIDAQHIQILNQTQDATPKDNYRKQIFLSFYSWVRFLCCARKRHFRIVNLQKKWINTKVLSSLAVELWILTVFYLRSVSFSSENLSYSTSITYFCWGHQWKIPCLPWPQQWEHYDPRWATQIASSRTSELEQRALSLDHRPWKHRIPSGIFLATCYQESEVNTQTRRSKNGDTKRGRHLLYLLMAWTSCLYDLIKIPVS